jgi:hypothetical protein
LYLLGNSNQTGMTLDGTGNYTGGSFYDDQIDGFVTAVNAIGHQTANPATTDWMNASTFTRLHIDCPTSGGYPIGGDDWNQLQQGDGNTFTGGDVEGCGTALHLGANAQNNTIVGLRNENSTNQVMADAGSSYNNWMTGRHDVHRQVDGQRDAQQFSGYISSQLQWDEWGLVWQPAGCDGDQSSERSERQRGTSAGC